MAARGGPGRFEFEDDRTGVRSNNHHFAYDFMARGERRVGGSRVYAGAYRHYRRRHLPGEDWMEAKRARQNRELTLAYAGVRRPGLLTPDLDGEARAHFLQQRVWLVDDEGELGPPRDELMVWTRFGGDFHLDFYGLPNHQLALYVSFYEDDCRPESKLDDEVEKLHYRRSSMFITLSDQVWFLDGRLRVTPSVRYFHHDHQYDGPSLLRLQGEKFDRSSFTTATADVFLTYQLADGLWLTASVAQYYRPPSLLEEFGDRTRLIGNPDLTPERSMVEQAGLLYRPGPFSVVDDLRVELTVFHHQSHHLIAWQEAGEGRLRAENSGDARSVGVELSASLNLQDLLIVEAAYTFQETENLADDKEIRGGQLPGAPRNTAYLSAIVRRASGQVFYTLNYQDQRYLDPQNRISADPRLIHNLGVIYYRGRFSVGAEAVNIGNDRGPEVLGYPLPGTRYLIFMEVKI